jgi:hypothetical protein
MFTCTLRRRLTGSLIDDCFLLSRARNSDRQCHFKIWLDCHKLKKCPCLIMPMQQNVKKLGKE